MSRPRSSSTLRRVVSQRSSRRLRCSSTRSSSAIEHVFGRFRCRRAPTARCCWGYPWARAGLSFQNGAFSSNSTSRNVKLNGSVVRDSAGQALDGMKTFSRLELKDDTGHGLAIALDAPAAVTVSQAGVHQLLWGRDLRIGYVQLHFETPIPPGGTRRLRSALVPLDRDAGDAGPLDGRSDAGHSDGRSEDGGVTLEQTAMRVWSVCRRRWRVSVVVSVRPARLFCWRWLISVGGAGASE